uniref:hypothetical protein n=1 Tax=Halopiger xanaduensis TaxID=387343 RepID=UPI001FE1A1BD|nr:hypothetical protein [Halopiger xanaduensis]
MSGKGITLAWRRTHVGLFDGDIIFVCFVNAPAVILAREVVRVRVVLKRNLVETVIRVVRELDCGLEVVVVLVTDLNNTGVGVIHAHGDVDEIAFFARSVPNEANVSLIVDHFDRCVFFSQRIGRFEVKLVVVSVDVGEVGGELLILADVLERQNIFIILVGIRIGPTAVVNEDVLEVLAVESVSRDVQVLVGTVRLDRDIRRTVLLDGATVERDIEAFSRTPEDVAIPGTVVVTDNIDVITSLFQVVSLDNCRASVAVYSLFFDDISITVDFSTLSDLNSVSVCAETGEVDFLTEPCIFEAFHVVCVV